MLERDLVLVPEVEAIRGYENTTGLGSLESGRVAMDDVATTVRGGRSRTKAVVVARATVRRSRRRGRSE